MSLWGDEKCTFDWGTKLKTSRPTLYISVSKIFRGKPLWSINHGKFDHFFQTYDTLFRVWKVMEHLVVESTLVWLSWVDSIDSNSFELVDKSYSFVSACCLCLTLVIVVISWRKFMAKFWFPGRIQSNKNMIFSFVSPLENEIYA